MNFKARLLFWLAFILALIPIGAQSVSDFKVPSALDNPPHPPPFFPPHPGAQEAFMNSMKLPAVHAYVRIFSPRGIKAGYGTVSIENSRMKMGNPFRGARPRRRVPPLPQFSFVQLGQERFLPEDTDSITVWDVTGIPDSSAWIFRLADGRIGAYAYFPGRYVQVFTLGNPAKPPVRDTNSQLAFEDLKRRLRQVPRAYLEWENDPMKAVHLFNAAREEEFGSGSDSAVEFYRRLRDEDRIGQFSLQDTLMVRPSDMLVRLASARMHCRLGRHVQAREDLAAAKRIDAGYYLLAWVEGLCEEMKGDPQHARQLYTQALEYAPSGGPFRSQVSEALAKLGRK